MSASREYCSEVLGALHELERVVKASEHIKKSPKLKKKLLRLIRQVDNLAVCARHSYY